MKRHVGIVGIALVAVGLVLGTVGGVAGQALGQSDTGYGDDPTDVLGEERERGDEPSEPVPVTGGEDLDDPVEPGTTFEYSADGFGPNTKGELELRPDGEGEALALAGSGLDQAQQVELSGGVLTLAFFTADENGNVALSVRLPDDLAEGDYELVAVGVDPEGNPLEVASRITVAVGGDGGFQVSWLVIAALAVATVGGAWVMRARRTDPVLAGASRR